MYKCEYLKERRPLTAEKVFYCLKHRFFVDYETYNKYCTKKHVCLNCPKGSLEKGSSATDV